MRYKFYFVYKNIIMVIVLSSLIFGCDFSFYKNNNVSRAELEKNSARGDVEAMYILARELCCSANESGFNYARSYKLFCEAAKKNHAKSQYFLGSLYEIGLELQLNNTNTLQEPFLLPRDYSLAYMWYSIAANQGLSIAEKARKKIAKQMTIEQLNQAITQRRTWHSINCNDY